MCVREPRYRITIGRLTFIALLRVFKIDSSWQFSFKDSLNRILFPHIIFHFDMFFWSDCHVGGRGFVSGDHINCCWLVIAIATPLTHQKMMVINPLTRSLHTQNNSQIGMVILEWTSWFTKQIWRYSLESFPESSQNVLYLLNSISKYPSRNSLILYESSSCVIYSKFLLIPVLASFCFWSLP